MNAPQKQPVALVVTSDKSTWEIVEEALGRLSYCVLQCETGLDGLLAMGPHIDMIICDRELEIVDGLKFVVEIRKMRLSRHVPILMLVPPERRIESAFIVGVDEAMYKPIALDRFICVCLCLMSVRNSKDAIQRRNEYQRALAKLEESATNRKKGSATRIEQPVAR
ncbi:MAG: response regulator [Planctomycetota bacterium]|nr:response regulator [Planctomycetota bacterium]